MTKSKSIKNEKTDKNIEAVKTDKKAKGKAKGKAKSKTKAKGKNKAITIESLTKNVKVSQSKMKVDRTAQIKNKGIPTPRNAMVNSMIKNGPVKKIEVVQAILTKYPTTSDKMAKRTITRGKNKKYNDKYTNFDSLIIEQKIEGVAYLAFTEKAFADLKAKAKTENKTENKTKNKAKKTEKV